MSQIKHYEDLLTSKKSDMNFLKKMFDKQSELIDKYFKMERDVKSGYVPNANPIMLDDPDYQSKLRMIAWFITEELSEYLEAKQEYSEEEVAEELSDVLHFMIELCIYSGVTSQDILSLYEMRDNYKVFNQEENFFRGMITSIMTITVSQNKEITGFRISAYASIGIAINNLKNKPWKQTEVKTNRQKYKNDVINAFANILSLIIIELRTQSMEEVYEIYMKKHNKNNQRIQEKY